MQMHDCTYFFQSPLRDINIIFTAKDAPNFPSSRNQQVADPGQGLLPLSSPCFVPVCPSGWSWRSGSNLRKPNCRINIVTRLKSTYGGTRSSSLLVSFQNRSAEASLTVLSLVGSGCIQVIGAFFFEDQVPKWINRKEGLSAGVREAIYWVKGWHVLTDDIPMFLFYGGTLLVLNLQAFLCSESG